MHHNSYYGAIFFLWIFIEVESIDNLNNSPPIMFFDRTWKIDENEPVGSKIVKVEASDNDGDPLLFSLQENSFLNYMPPKRLPFRIDPLNGNVYLNESIKGRAGQQFTLYVTVSDGHTPPSKHEVWVQILKPQVSPIGSSRNPHWPNGSGPNKFFPNFPNLHTHPSQQFYNPASEISNNPFNYYPKTQKPQILTPIKTQTEEQVGNHVSKKNEQPKTTTMPATAAATDASATESEHINNHIEQTNRTPIDQAVKSVPEFTTTIVPIVSVGAVFLIVGIIAVTFRKKIYLGKVKTSKDDMRKESSGAMVIQNDPGLGMEQWRGPRAFSNRYEPWDRDGNHSQVVYQISSSIKDGDHWEFARHRLKFFNILGEGAFGQVWKCEATDIDSKEGVSVVAVKTLKESANDKEKSDLLSELKVMKMLEPHPNVVRLLGCCTEKEPIFLIMEYISKGKLQSYLRNSRAERYYNNMHGQSKSLTSRDLTSFVYQVAKGMEFLSANGIIHRDLAARNILITEEHTCKVADFGFARDVITSHVYERKSEGRLPIRWMAPESLYDNIFSVKSDVWSFGVLIWEVVTLGSTPYPGLSAAEVMRRVRDGFRLDKPEHCRRELYNIMYYCWDKDPKARPSFTECVQLLEKLLLTETDYIELERFPDHSYYNMMSLSGEKL